MKTLLSLLIAILIAVSAFAGTVRITFEGNANKDIRVELDGRVYHSKDYISSTSNQLVLQNLQDGEHSVIIYRVNKRGRTKQLYESSFNLQANQEIHLTVNQNGTITREESFSHPAYGAMSDVSFGEVYRRVSNEWTQANKVSTATDVFNTSSYYFSTYQARQIIELINSESSRLQLAKLAYDNIVDKENFRELSYLLNSQASRNDLENFIDYSENQGTFRIAMSDVAFNQIYQDVFNQRTQAAKMARALSAFNVSSNYYTTAQARQLIAMINNENSRVQLAKASFDNIADQANFRQMYDIFYRQASRDELNAFISSQGILDDDPMAGRIAMSDTKFNELYEDIEAIWWPGGEMNAIRDAFNSETNFFSTVQARKLIELVSWEANRLELAKLSFDNVVDQQNFRQLYDLFETQSSKDELDSYIRSVHNYRY